MLYAANFPNFSAGNVLVVVPALGPLAGVLIRLGIVGTPGVRGLVLAREVNHALVRVAVIANLLIHLPALSVGP